MNDASAATTASTRRTRALHQLLLLHVRVEGPWQVEVAMCHCEH